MMMGAAMNKASLPLAASAIRAEADWPGVVGQLCPDWRLVVSSDGKRYTLQQRIVGADGERWASAGGKSPATLARIRAKYAPTVKGLAALCDALPIDPAEAAPSLVAAIRAKDAVFEARDIARNDYARVVARDGQIRLAVDPDGLLYVLQWVKLADARADAPDLRWRRLFDAPALSDVRGFVLDKVAGLDGPGRAGLVRGDDLSPRWQALVAGLPERADAGVWPFIPPLPGPSQA